MFKDLKKNFYELFDDKKLESNKIIKQETIKNEIIPLTKKKTMKAKIDTKITNKDK